jgi:DNA-directed RNA polymerase specialized sigma24 family protein
LNFGSISVEDIAGIGRAVARRSSSALCDADREDLVADILCDAVAASRRTGIPIAPLALKGVTRDRYFDAARRRRQQQLAELALGEPDDTDQHAPSSFGVEEILGASDLAGDELAVKDLLKRLPEESRIAFYMCAMCGETLADAAAHLRVSISTVYERVTRARHALQLAWFAAEAA